MRGSLLLVIATALGCRRHTPAPPVAAVASVLPAAPDAGPDADDAASVALAPSMDPVAALPPAALMAAEAWALAGPAIDRLPPEQRSTFAFRLARARAAVGVCSTTEGTRALEELAAARPIAPADAGIQALIARLEVDAWVCAERWTDALAVAGPAGLRARKGALAARTRARALEATGDFEGARVALDEAIAGAAGTGLDRGKLLARRLAILRRLPSKPAHTAAAEADVRTLYLELPATFEKLTPSEPAPAALRAVEWLRRAEALAGLGRADDALAAIVAAGATTDPPSARALARARGKVLYRAKAYARAAVALDAAALLGGTDDDAIDDAFHAARARSRAGDDDAAIAAYETLAKKHSAGYGAEAAWLAAQLRYLHGKWPDALLSLDRYLAGPWAKAPKQETNVREARRARAIALLASGKSQAAEKAFEKLADDTHEPFARARLGYLGAVAAEKGGDAVSARKTYAALAVAHPYSFLDLAGRARRLALGDPPPAWAIGPVERSPLPTIPAPLDALVRVGLRRDLPWHSLAKGPSACAAADAMDDGATAYRLGVPEASPLSRCAWPTPWEPVVAALEAREGLPPGLLHSILRQESAFILEAVSPAGAVGIAQMLPSTAAMTAQRLGRTLDPEDIAGLKAPYLQLELSAHHLSDLYRELSGKDPARYAAVTALVIAAYNAGAHATRRWVTEAGDLDADVFVERIPFLETRLYVVRVLSNLVRYSILSGAPVPVWPARFTSL